MKIYIDLFFLFNVIMDFMIILGTSIILKRNSNLIRIIISSLIGGVSSILLFDNINKILIEVISIIIMVLISFGYKEIKYVLRNIFYMYLLSALIGGIIYLFNVKVSNNIVINYFMESENIRWNGWKMGTVVIMMFAGIVVETYMNPPVVKWMLEIFSSIR